MQKFFFEILVLTALTVGLIWTILELTPKSALLSLTILYSIRKFFVINIDLIKTFLNLLTFYFIQVSSRRRAS